MYLSQLSPVVKYAFPICIMPRKVDRDIRERVCVRRCVPAKDTGCGHLIWYFGNTALNNLKVTSYMKTDGM